MLNVKEILDRISSDIYLLQLADVFEREYENVKALRTALERHFSGKGAKYCGVNTVTKRVVVKGQISDLVSKYEWITYGKKLKLEPFRLVTYTPCLTELGIPKSTIYRLIKKGIVKAGKIQIGDYKVYEIDTVDLLNVLPSVLEDAIKRSLKAKEVAERRYLAEIRASELGIPYDYRLADDEYYNKIKNELIESAKKLREEVDKLDKLNKVLSYLIILNRYAKTAHPICREKLYDLKEKVLRKLLPKVRVVRFLDYDYKYYALWELEFEYKGPIRTFSEGLATFHIPYPKIKNTEFEEQLKKLCSETLWRDDGYYGSSLNFVEKVAFPLEDVLAFLQKFVYSEN